MVYQPRLLLYADILGWSAEAQQGDGSKLLAAVQLIHQHADALNERSRAELRSQDGKPIEVGGVAGIARVNPVALEVQFGAFSDHFVFSMPVSFGGRIFSAASKLTISLLRAGYLIRGAVVLGPLYHSDNVIFGPALLTAVDMEEREAFYPRILVSESVVQRCAILPSDPRFKSVLEDQSGRKVVNPFALPLDGPADVMDSFIQENFALSEIKTAVDSQIAALESAGRHAQAEKWRYQRRFIEGPVCDASPILRRHWCARQV